MVRHFEFQMHRISVSPVETGRQSETVPGLIVPEIGFSLTIHLFSVLGGNNLTTMQVMPVQYVETSPNVSYSISFKVDATFCVTCFYYGVVDSFPNLIFFSKHLRIRFWIIGSFIGYEIDTEKLNDTCFWLALIQYFFTCCFCSRTAYHVMKRACKHHIGACQLMRVLHVLYKFIMHRTRALDPDWNWIALIHKYYNIVPLVYCTRISRTSGDYSLNPYTLLVNQYQFVVKFSSFNPVVEVELFGKVAFLNHFFF